MPELKENDRIQDDQGNLYTLNKRIGRGGQGVVWSVKEGPLAVKICSSSGIGREELRRRLQALKILDLENLPISAPLTVLKAPLTGYVMHFVRGLQSLQLLLRPPAQVSPSLWYKETGGLRWRLRILSAVAEVLARLHGKGLAYGDPSPANLLVPEKPCAEPNVFLIDSDNIRSNSQGDHRFLYTPGYGAPEVIAGSHGVSTLSDAHGFAVIAYQVLTLNHPFIGDSVHDAEPEEEELAFAGEKPWIEHSRDTSNRSTRGIASEKVLSGNLKELFARAFEDGLHDAVKRPGLGAWAEALLQASDAVVDCQKCDSGFYFKAVKCPWPRCGADPPVKRMALIHIWDPEMDPDPSGRHFLTSADPKTGAKKARIIHGVAMQAEKTILFRRRHFFSDVSEEPDAPVCRVMLTKRGAEIRNLSAFPLYARSFSKGEKPREKVASPDGEITIPADGKEPLWYLHADSHAQLHRAVRF